MGPESLAPLQARLLATFAPQTCLLISSNEAVLDTLISRVSHRHYKEAPLR